MITPWQFELLGGLRARQGPIVVTRFATSRVALLLARLCLFPHRPHPREELIDLLWPEADRDSGRNSLRVAVSSLRRQLEPPGTPPGTVLIADRSAVRLSAVACRSDAAEFEAALAAAAQAPHPAQKLAALDKALALFGGELLPGFYDEWVVWERERLNGLHEDACRQRAALHPQTPLAPPAPPPSAAIPPSAEEPSLRGLPLQFTRFFGREADSAAAAALLAEPGARLLTLTGPGGAGKTRLAAEVARLVTPKQFASACWVSLADLSQASLMPSAIAQALGLTRAPSVEPLDQVVAALAAEPPALLVLDNFEHLADGGAPLLFSLLSRVPHLTCLVTSRRRLGLPGEREQIVPPLPLPDAQASLPQLAANAGVQMFVDRAQSARPDFQIAASNASAIAALCRTLEGIPLAIELVAARALALTPAQMNERLAARILPPDAPREKGAAGRHSSLRAAISWSYSLIPSELQRFFAGLSVFRGGCTLEAAAAVCAEPGALECLTQLRERSLLMLEDTASGIRFRLLETLRAYGLERLVESGDEATARARHRQFFLGLAETVEPKLGGADANLWLARLTEENDNLRAALENCLAAGDADTVQTGLRLAAALGKYWQSRGALIEGRRWLTLMLEHEGAGAPTSARAWAMRWAGVLALYQGDYPAAEEWCGKALALFRTLGEGRGSAWALLILANADAVRGHYDKARDFYQEALPLFRAAGDTLGIGGALNNLGNILLANAELAEAKPLYEEALTLLQASGNLPGCTIMLTNLGAVAYYQGDLPEARRHLEEALTLRTQLGSRGDQSGYALAVLAMVSLGEGNLAEAGEHLHEALTACRDSGDQAAANNLLDITARLLLAQSEAKQAARMLGAAERFRKETGILGDRVGQDAYDHDARQIRAALTPDEFQEAWKAGRLLSWEQMVDEALEVVQAVRSGQKV